jgi:hypothetical protein
VLGSSVPGTSNPGSHKGVRTPERRASRVTAAWRLQRPKRHLSPTWGKRVGQRGREADLSHRGQEQSWRQRTERDGGRHPGSREARALRGALVEHEPRSVHVVRMRILSCGREHRRQRMSGGRRGGERSFGVRPFKAHAPGSRANFKQPLVPRERRVLLSVLRPVRVNRH